MLTLSRFQVSFGYLYDLRIGLYTLSDLSVYIGSHSVRGITRVPMCNRLNKAISGLQESTSNPYHRNSGISDPFKILFFILSRFNCSLKSFGAFI